MGVDDMSVEQIKKLRRDSREMVKMIDGMIITNSEVVEILEDYLSTYKKVDTVLKGSRDIYSKLC